MLYLFVSITQLLAVICVMHMIFYAMSFFASSFTLLACWMCAASCAAFFASSGKHAHDEYNNNNNNIVKKLTIQIRSKMNKSKNAHTAFESCNCEQ